ncbi:MAG: hypothetical protein Q9181_007059 [Wetmoreana brouardii]
MRVTLSRSYLPSLLTKEHVRAIVSKHQAARPHQPSTKSTGKRQLSPLLFESSGETKATLMAKEPECEIPLRSSNSCGKAKTMTLKRQIIDVSSDDEEWTVPKASKPCIEASRTTIAADIKALKSHFEQSCKILKDGKAKVSKIMERVQQAYVEAQRTVEPQAHTDFFKAQRRAQNDIEEALSSMTKQIDEAHTKAQRSVARVKLLNQIEKEMASSREAIADLRKHARQSLLEVPGSTPIGSTGTGASQTVISNNRLGSPGSPLVMRAITPVEVVKELTPEAPASRRSTSWKHTHTVLMIYDPASQESYVPVKLQSCPTMHELFSNVGQAWDIPVDQISAVRIQFVGGQEGAQAEGGIMRLKQGMEDPYECFLEKVENDVTWQSEGRGQCKVRVEVDLKGSKWNHAGVVVG